VRGPAADGDLLEEGRFDPSLPLAARIAAVSDRRIEDVRTPGP
jgi:DNA-binding XRE family transcriptional regulator